MCFAMSYLLDLPFTLHSNSHRVGSHLIGVVGAGSRPWTVYLASIKAELVWYHPAGRRTRGIPGDLTKVRMSCWMVSINDSRNTVSTANALLRRSVVMVLLVCL